MLSLSIFRVIKLESSSILKKKYKISCISYSVASEQFRAQYGLINIIPVIPERTLVSRVGIIRTMSSADRRPRLNLVQVIKPPCKSVGPVTSLLGPGQWPRPRTTRNSEINHAGTTRTAVHPDIAGVLRVSFLRLAEALALLLSVTFAPEILDFPITSMRKHLQPGDAERTTRDEDLWQHLISKFTKAPRAANVALTVPS